MSTVRSIAALAIVSQFFGTGCDGSSFTGHVNDYDEDCTIPAGEDCYIPVVLDAGVQLVQGRYRDAPWRDDAATYCGIACMSPSECETADDCALDPCTYSECVEGRCVNVSYPDGSLCIAVDPWTKVHHVGACDGCYCRPKYEP